MTPAPDTGRTAEAMRAEILAALNAAFRGFSFPCGRWSTGYRAEMAADALLDGPIAQIQADLTAARKERDEMRYLVDRLKGEVAAYATEAQLNLEDAAIKETWLEAAREEAAQLRSRLLQAEQGGEIYLDTAMKRGIRAWSARLHIPVTRMMSRVLREEIKAALAAKGAPLPDSDTGGKGAA